MNLNEALDCVRSFHVRIGAPVAKRPQLLAGHPGKTLAACALVGRIAKELSRGADGEKDMVLCRAAMVLEELAEWLYAHANPDLVKAADAIDDRFYVLLGDAVATGLPLEALFEVVHTSNMTKLGAVHTGVGKAVKGGGYERPEIAEILANNSKQWRRDSLNS
jgi:predicted HAD superfamily Cof-like phosphohydrolase